MKKKEKINLNKKSRKSYKSKHRFFLTISSCLVVLGAFLFSILIHFTEESYYFDSPFDVENDDYLASYKFNQSMQEAYSNIMAYGSLILRQQAIAKNETNTTNTTNETLQLSITPSQNDIIYATVNSPSDDEDEVYNSYGGDFKIMPDDKLPIESKLYSKTKDFQERVLSDRILKNFDYYISYKGEYKTNMNNINPKKMNSAYDIDLSDYPEAYFVRDGSDITQASHESDYYNFNFDTQESYYHKPTNTYIFLHSADETPEIFSFSDSDNFKKSSIMGEFWNLYYNYYYNSNVAYTYVIPRNEFNQRVIQKYWGQRLPSKVNDQNGNCIGYYVDGDDSLLYQVIVDNNVYYIAFEKISDVYDYYIDSNISLPRFTVQCEDKSSYINVTFNNEECKDFENILRECKVNYTLETNSNSTIDSDFYMLDESDFQVFIAPNPQKIATIQSAYQAESHKLTAILYATFATLLLAFVIFIVSAVFATMEGRVNGVSQKSVPIDINILTIGCAILGIIGFALFLFKIFSNFTILAGIFLSLACAIAFALAAFNFNSILQKIGAGEFLKKLLLVIILSKIKKANKKYKENQDPKTFSYKFRTAMQTAKTKVLEIATLLHINTINVAIVFMSLFSLVLFMYAYDQYYIISGGEFQLVMFIEVIFIIVILVLIRLKKLMARIEDVCLARESKIEEPKRFNIFKKQYEQLNDINQTIEENIESQMQAERMKIELVTNVSHDLKTPLTSIIGYINLLSMEEDLSPRCRDYVQILEKKSDKLNQIVKDVFDISKAVSGIEVEKEKLDLCMLLRQVLGDMTTKMEESNKVFCIDIGMKKADIMGDGIKIYRIIQNLVDNAIKYSLADTKIHLQMYQKEDFAVIEIKNVASYKMEFTPEEIVERFARGDRARTTEGNGLGLSIAKSFTEANDGNFVIETDGDLFKARAEFPLIINN